MIKSAPCNINNLKSLRIQFFNLGDEVARTKS